MKRIKQIYTPILSGVFIMLVFASCSKDNEINYGDTLATLIEKDTSLSIFNAALKQTGLNTFTEGPGPFTIFGVSNAAYRSRGVNSIADLKLVDSGDLRVQTTWLIAPGTRSSNDLIGSNLTITTQSGSSIFAQLYNNEVYLNGVKAVKRDIRATNGSLFVVDSYIYPTLGSTSVTLNLHATRNFKLFTQAATRASLAGTGTGINKNTTTVFAVTNAAMEAAGYDSATISKTAVATLANIVKLHIIGAVNFRYALQSGVYKTEQGNSITVNLSSTPPTISWKGNSARILSFDQPTTNGVIHTVDKLLIP